MTNNLNYQNYVGNLLALTDQINQHGQLIEAYQGVHNSTWQKLSTQLDGFLDQLLDAADQCVSIQQYFETHQPIVFSDKRLLLDASVVGDANVLLRQRLQIALAMLGHLGKSYAEFGNEKVETLTSMLLDYYEALARVYICENVPAPSTVSDEATQLWMTLTASIPVVAVCSLQHPDTIGYVLYRDAVLLHLLNNCALIDDAFNGTTPTR